MAPSPSRAATVIGDQTSAYTLTPGGDNSFVINAGTTITSATDGITGGSSVGYWAINNAGTINVQGEGFYLLASTNLSNSGSITSQTTIAVDLLAGGNFTNTSTGVVTGGSYGFRSEGYGAVTNAGSISGGFEGANISYGTLTNQVGATISASEANSSGVFVSTVDTLVNAGTISTTGTGNAAGVTLFAGGAVTNQSGGTITSGAYGIFVANSSGAATITNAGTITGGNKQAIFGDSLNGNLSLNNQGGVINGDVELLGGANMVDDSSGGQINGNLTFSGSGNRLITDFGSVSSPIVGISGTISGGSNNVLQLNLTTNVTLSSAISLPSDFQTLAFGVGDNANLTIASGTTLTSAVNLYAVSANAGFTNNGAITTTGSAIVPSGMNFNYYGPAGPSVTNNGTITATFTNATPGQPYAIYQGIYGLGNITNTGTITSVGGGGVATTMYGTEINNSGTITADDTALYTFDGIVSNSGTIRSNNGVGLYAYGNSGMPASNSGLIYGGTIGADLMGYTLTNTGTISSPGMAVSVDPYGTLINEASGVINGNIGSALYGFAIQGTIQNSGTINGTINLANTTQLYSLQYFDVNISNNLGGVINGSVTIGDGSITNAGTIDGGSQSVVFVGGGSNTLTLQTGSALVGDAVGSTYSGADNALVLQGTGTANNNFLNFNTLSVQASGVWTLGGTSSFGTTTVVTGTLVNTGSLTSALTVDAGAGFTNSGTFTDISGLGVQLQGDATLINQKGGTITGGGVGVNVADSGSVTNAGTITGATWGVYGQNSATVVNNSGSISGTGTSSTGVLLLAGGTVNNYAGGTISGGSNGIYSSGPATVTNAGSITSTGFGVSLEVGGSLTNQTGGVITGGTVGAINYGTGSTVSNSGSISGTNATGFGVVSIGGAVANLAGGTITGGQAGVYLVGATATATNAGSITAKGVSYASGVVIAGGGSLTNDASGTISGARAGVYGVGGAASVTNSGSITATGTGGAGVLVAGGGSVTNAGSITGSAASVEFTEAGANTLTLQTGSTLNGAAYGSTATGATNALILQGTGTANNAFADFNTLNVQATGSWTLGGTSAIGATEVASGTLIVTGALASAFTVDSGATLQGSGASLAGDITDNGTLVFDQASAGVFANAITGSGQLIKQDAGLLALNGVSSIAATAVNGGNLQIGDAAHASAQLTSNVTVNTGGTLSGHGTVVGNVANNGGTVSPGGTIGTLTINGNYTQTSASVLSIETTPDTSSKLVVTGTATLAGTLQFVTDPGFYRKGTQYDFLSAASVTGTFSSVTATNGATFSVTVGPNGAIVTETAGAYTPVGNATANQRAVGAAFINYPIGVSDFDPVANALIALPTAAGQNAAYDRLGGEVDADFLTVARDDVRSFLGGVEDQNAGGGSPKSGPNAAWGYVTGSADTVHGDGNAHGFDQHAGGVVFGGERDLGANTRLGAAFDYSHSDFSLQGLDQNGALDTVAGGVYGRQNFGDLFLDAAASVGWETGKSTRVIAFTGVDRRATGSFDGASVGGLISFGDRIHGPDGLLIEPSISIIGSSVRQGGFTESGATGADLAVDSQTQGTAEALVGARFSKSFPMASGKLSLDGRLDWAHELSTETPTIGESFAAAAGTHFVVAGADPGKDFAVIGAGLTYSASSRLSVFVRYNGAMSSQQSDQAGTLGVKYSW